MRRGLCENRPGAGAADRPGCSDALGEREQRLDGRQALGQQ